jgi:hypothetical protein
MIGAKLRAIHAIQVVFAPQGLQHSAQGFNPGILTSLRSALKGCKIRGDNIHAEKNGLVHVSSRPFRANRFIGCLTGLKPWAKSSSRLRGEERSK